MRKIKNRLCASGSFSTGFMRNIIVIVSVGFHSLVYSENVITPGFHSYNLDKTSQTILGKKAEFKVTGGIEKFLNGGVQYLYRFDNGFSFGGEFEMNSWVYDSPENPRENNFNDATYRGLYLVVKKYFTIKNILKPYVGFGFGYNEVDLNGDIDAHLEGKTGQLHAGLSIMFTEHAGFDFLFKRVQGSSTDVNGGEMDLNGNMFFLGMTFQH